MRAGASRAILDQEGRWEGAYDSEELSLYYANAFMYLCKECAQGMRDERAGILRYSLGLLMNGLKDYIGEKG